MYDEVFLCADSGGGWVVGGRGDTMILGAGSIGVNAINRRRLIHCVACTKRPSPPIWY